MNKKIKIIFILGCLTICLSGMYVFAEQKTDAAQSPNTTVIIVNQKPAQDKIAKQKKVVPKQQTNWSKIKDLFM
jgi:hypothetical protein